VEAVNFKITARGIEKNQFLVRQRLEGAPIRRGIEHQTRVIGETKDTLARVLIGSLVMGDVPSRGADIKRGQLELNGILDRPSVENPGSDPLLEPAAKPPSLAPIL